LGIEHFELDPGSLREALLREAEGLGGGDDAVPRRGDLLVGGEGARARVDDLARDLDREAFLPDARLTDARRGGVDGREVEESSRADAPAARDAEVVRLDGAPERRPEHAARHARLGLRDERTPRR